MKKLFLVLGAACLLVVFRAGAQTPVITAEPQSVTVNNASAATFTVAASNALTFQWYFQGTNMLAGATNAALSLDDVGANQAGSYAVVVTSSNNISVTSAPPAVLTVVPGTIVQWTISTYPGGGSNTFAVQLFDHDKPATVANFIHYITSGAYSNMFFDRDAAGFVLQGGDDASSDRTTNHLSFHKLVPGTNFPAQVDNEFGVGPLIHNRFGTLAMAQLPQETNSANTAFFFNLVDNSTGPDNLDSQYFTVFGRILYGTNTGSNILSYFNTLSAPSNGIYPYNANFATLPVNYSGTTNAPTDANLFYCDFSFPSPPPVITNPPVVTITFPTANEVFTNNSNFTITGTALDPIGGLAGLSSEASALAGIYAGDSNSFTVMGTTNWSIAFDGLSPGVYEVTTFAQDGVGNQGSATVYFTNLAVLTIVTNVAGVLTTNTNALQYFVPGEQVSVMAEPAVGEQFVNWQIQGTVSLDPMQTFTSDTNLTIEVTYALTNFPVSIKSPAAGSVVTASNAGLTISGTIPPSITVTQLTVKLISGTNTSPAALPAVVTGTNWSLAVSNLAGGLYTIQVFAADSLGGQGYGAENFTALVPPVLVSPPANLTVNAGSSAQFTVVAEYAATYQWSLQGTNLPGATGATLSLDDVSTTQAGSYTVQITSTDGASVTNATATLTVLQGTILQWTISRYADGSSSNFLVELFDHDKPATVENFIHYVTSGAYSNMFFDRDVTNFVLQGGDYASGDRTNSSLIVHQLSPGTNFPSQVDNEFGVGPLIHNRFGTLAMAQQAGKTNSANTAFFFNLADNTAGTNNLDIQYFTVFGRILYGTNSGSNVLQYFNTLSPPSNGIYAGFSDAPTFPVNDDGTNEPTDANLFYCDFAFITPPPVITTPPTVSLTYPASNSVITYGSNLTVTGTASDNVGGLAEVFCVLTALAGSNYGQIQTNAAVGTTQWSLSLGTNPPGVYQLTAYAQDGAGNLSAPVTVYFTNMATLPPGLGITNPAAGSVVTAANAVLMISGILPSSDTVTQLTVQLFSQSTAATTALPAVINGTSWSLAVSNLAGGAYTIVAAAEDSLGREGFAMESFTALVPLGIVSPPASLTVNAGSAAQFAVVANYAAAYQWSFQGTNLPGATSATLSLDDLSTNQAGSYSVLVTSTDGISTTNETAVLTIVQGTIIQWTISKFADGSSSNFLVELFDHDKPATVENFIHYVASGAYSNIFFYRDVPGFVLQAGDYATVDRSTNLLNVTNVSTGTNIFPSQVVNEFNVGPLVHNTYGTLAALGSSDLPNRASGFLFNLEDNSSDLDGYEFTVFGRILYGTNSGSNVLQYFNTLSTNGNGIFNYTNVNTNFDLSSLPVNYAGTNPPTDASVFYCDFKFIYPTHPPVNTNLPTVSISFPAPNEVFTNGYDLTITGTASNSLGLAEVYCVLTSSTSAYNDQSQVLTAQGTTNWSVDVGDIEPGVYQLTAYAVSGAGLQSAPATVYFTNLAILTIITNTDGVLTTNAPLYLVPGKATTVTAMPGPGQLFYDWTVNGVASLNQVQTFTNINANQNLVVTYLPAGASTGLTITSPANGTQAISIQSVLTVSGAITSTNVTQVTCRFFLDSNSISGALPATVLGTNWTISVTNFANGYDYTVVASATNSLGQTSFASATFGLKNVEILTLKTIGQGTIVNTNPVPYIAPGSYTVKAVPAKGYVFYNWNNGVTATLNPVNNFEIVSNLTLTATFIPQDTSLTGITFTYPPANAMLTNSTFNVAGTLPASLAITQLTCQLFLQSNGLTASPQFVNLEPSATKWTLPVTNLTPGQYSILAVGYDNKGHSRLVSENFNLLSKLVVNTHGGGTVTAGLNGKYLQVGKTYSISATPKTGQLFAFWEGGVASPSNAATTFVMSTNTALTANFASNYFPSLTGTYTGLFLDPAGVFTNTAGFIKITLSSSGIFSGDLSFPSFTYGIYSKFPYNGSVFLYAVNVFNTNDHLAGVLNLDLTNGTDTITGYVGDLAPSGQYNWASSLVLYRSVTGLSGSNAPAAGKYVLLMQPENAASAPAAAGYAAVSLAGSGALSLVGALPDNTAISESAKMSKQGIWPVYIALSSNREKGMVLGWQTNTLAGACNGQLFWCKPGGGQATNLTSSGGIFAAPVANTSYQMILAGGTGNSLPVRASGKFVPQLPVVSITLQAGGVLSGYIDVGDEKLPFKGAFIDPASGGGGFIIVKNGPAEGFQITLDNN